MTYAAAFKKFTQNVIHSHLHDLPNLYGDIFEFTNYYLRIFMQLFTISLQLTLLVVHNTYELISKSSEK